MANKYFINLPEKTTPEDSNILPIEDSQDTKRMTWSNLVKPIKNMIGNLATLKTAHKSTIVGSNNELFDKIESVPIQILYHTGSTLIENAVKNFWDDLRVTVSLPADAYILRVAGNRIGLAIVAKASDNTGEVLLIKASGIITMSYDGSTWTQT